MSVAIAGKKPANTAAFPLLPRARIAVTPVRAGSLADDEFSFAGDQRLVSDLHTHHIAKLARRGSSFAFWY